MVYQVVSTEHIFLFQLEKKNTIKVHFNGKKAKVFTPKIIFPLESKKKTFTEPI